MSEELALDPNAQQRKASDPAKSVWVVASAGTGKTKVLTDRVLALLLAGSAPERILCLTFTKAAAAEMANRINQRLGDWAVLGERDLARDIQILTDVEPDDATMERARQLFARVLDAPGGLRIETIHAFCQSLLRRFPLEAGIPPHFQVMEERSAAEAMEQARAHVLERARTGRSKALRHALETVTQLTDADGFAQLLDRLASERGRLSVLRADGDAALENRLRDLLGLEPDETAESVVKSACKDGVFDAPNLKAACKALAKGGKDDQAASGALDYWLNASAKRRAVAFDVYGAAFFTQKGTIRSRLATKPAVAAMADVIAVMSAEASRLEAVRAKRDAALLAENTLALLRLGGAVLDTYAAYKSLRALLDFEDLVLKARALLHQPGVAPWVLFKLDGGLDHILIDEAQDTNPDQWAVVQALAEEFFAGSGAREIPRTVFAVGDPKQSIFSFQRADPRAFVAMKDFFEQRVRAAGRAWDDVELFVSFRSVAAVLKLVDAVFADQRAVEGVIPAEVRWLNHESFRPGSAGTIEIWPPIGPSEGEDTVPWDAPLQQARLSLPRARLAHAIAATVKDWIESGETLEARGRPIRAGDVMVLVRRRGPFVGALVRALKESGVPVAGVDRMILADQLAVQDLVALGEFLLLPNDDLTLATVLKGPLYGFDDDLLFKLAHPRKGALWDELRRRADETPIFTFAAKELSELLARADFIPPFELFAEVLGARGGRRKVLGRLGPEAGDPLDEFLSAALTFERDHGPSLQGFLHWLVLGELEVKRDLNNESQRDELRVITVHGAKGLQAPIVFLPDTLQVPALPHGLVWSEEGIGGLPLWLKEGSAPAARAAREIADRRRDEEYRRLLYVALTRAEDRLYVCGWTGERAAPEGNWYDYASAGLKAAGGKVFAFDNTKTLGEDGWAGEGVRLETRQQGPRKDKAARTQPAVAETEELPSWVTSPPPPEPSPPKPLQPSQPRHAEPATRSPLGADLGRIFRKGLMVHRLLQSLPLLAPDKREAAAQRFLARPVFDLPKADQKSIANETLAILSTPDFSGLFGPGSEAEVPVVGLLQGRAISGRIDRLVVSASEVLIVDYKTMRPVPETEVQVPAAYLDQMAAYRQVLAGIYPGKTIRCALLWTEGPKLMSLSDSVLDPHSA